MNHAAVAQNRERSPTALNSSSSRNHIHTGPSSSRPGARAKTPTRRILEGFQLGHEVPAVPLYLAPPARDHCRPHDTQFVAHRLVSLKATSLMVAVAVKSASPARSLKSELSATRLSLRPPHTNSLLISSIFPESKRRKTSKPALPLKPPSVSRARSEHCRPRSCSSARNKRGSRKKRSSGCWTESSMLNRPRTSASRRVTCPSPRTS